VIEESTRRLSRADCDVVSSIGCLLRRFLSYLTTIAAVTACAHGATTIGPRPSATTSDITAADLEKRLFLIASDSMMGREPGGLGNFKTAEYVANEFRRLGLKPAGENGTYFQIVPFFRADPTASHLELNGAALALGRDFLPFTLAAGGRSLNGARAIYAGDLTDSTTWPSAEAATGNIVVFTQAFGPLRGIGTQTRYERAASLALLVDSVPRNLVTRMLSGPLVLDSTRNPRIVPTILLTKAAASRLLGGDIGSLKAGATGPALTGQIDVPRRPTRYAARNVVAILSGSDPAVAGEYVSLTAHNDHVGFNFAPVDHDSIRAFNRVVRPMGADSRNAVASPEQLVRVRQILDSLRREHTPRPDSIFNGADDDGTGTVSILEIAEALAARPHPRRSILFVSHTGEESGLIGSAWFTDHATVPIDSIVAEIDQDMVGRGGATDLPEGGPAYLEVVGARRLSNEFGDLLEQANSRQPVPFVFNYTYDAPNHPLQYYCRADHYNYARYGIPSVAFSRGEHLDYHQVTDEPQYISYPDLARVSRMVLDAAVLIANGDHRPKLDAPKPTNPHAPCRQ
jgi:peptidase M28-like protein